MVWDGIASTRWVWELEMGDDANDRTQKSSPNKNQFRRDPATEQIFELYECNRQSVRCGLEDVWFESKKEESLANDRWLSLWLPCLCNHLIETGVGPPSTGLQDVEISSDLEFDKTTLICSIAATGQVSALSVASPGVRGLRRALSVKYLH
jgi:hypothetical protein